ncbi:MAG: alpha/beta hydrolase [Simkaniaceae bacterium]
MDLKNLHLEDDVEAAFVGPSLDKGPLPGLLYLSLSKEESLLLDPFNQPVQLLHSDSIRIFSLTIPGHGPDLDPKKALELWAESIASNEDPLTPFFQKASNFVDTLLCKNIASTLAVAGLSRGAFAACHIAKLNPSIQTILGFAPLLSLKNAEEFQDLQENPLLESLDLFKYLEALYNKNIRFYIGNRDKRVDTNLSCQFIQDLSDLAYTHRIRSAPLELILSPSIGYMGHGTSFETFNLGTKWLKTKL